MSASCTSRRPRQPSTMSASRSTRVSSSSSSDRPVRASRRSCGCCWRRDTDLREIQVSKFHVNKLSGRHIPKLRQVIGCVFQDFRLLQQKSVFENVAFALEVIGKKPDTINSGGARRPGDGRAVVRPTGCPPNCRAVSSSASRSRGRSSTAPWCCWPTSPPETSTPTPQAGHHGPARTDSTGRAPRC